MFPDECEAIFLGRLIAALDFDGSPPTGAINPESEFRVAAGDLAIAEAPAPFFAAACGFGSKPGTWAAWNHC
jgi:hypothetical protein